MLRKQNREGKEIFGVFGLVCFFVWGKDLQEVNSEDM